MNFIFELIVILIKLIIFLIGLIMLTGGGFCAVVMLPGIFKNLTNVGGAAFTVLMPIGIAIVGGLMMYGVSSKTKPYDEKAETSESDDSSNE